MRMGISADWNSFRTQLGLGWTVDCWSKSHRLKVKRQSILLKNKYMHRSCPFNRAISNIRPVSVASSTALQKTLLNAQSWWKTVEWQKTRRDDFWLVKIPNLIFQLFSEQPFVKPPTVWLTRIANTRVMFSIPALKKSTHFLYLYVRWCRSC